MLCILQYNKVDKLIEYCIGMDKKDLFELRKEGFGDFDNVKELGLFLNGLFGSDFTFPLVIGYENFSSDWKVKRLSALTTSAELTVRTYLECLNVLASGDRAEEFAGNMLYKGIDSAHYSNWDIVILSTDIWERGGNSHPQTFNLKIHLSHRNASGSEDSKAGYEAVSKIDPTRLEESCERFVGPGVKYKNLLI